MARRTIFLPDDLDAALKTMPASFNISQVCQQALRGEVERLEGPQPEDKTTEGILERFRAEKANFMKEAFSVGVADGINWAKKSSYSELSGWAEHARSVLTDIFCVPPFTIPDDLEPSEESFGETPHYQRGVLSGILRFWKLVEARTGR